MRLPWQSHLTPTAPGFILMASPALPSRCAMTAPTAATPPRRKIHHPYSNTRSFADLVEDLRSRGRATVLIGGAGCSLSGGIPLAGGIIEISARRFRKPGNAPGKKQAQPASPVTTSTCTKAEPRPAPHPAQGLY